MTRRTCIAIAAGLGAGALGAAAIVGLSHAGVSEAARPAPYSSFDTTTNVITVAAPLTAKFYSGQRPTGTAEPHWVFRFVIGASNTSVWVSPEVYDRYRVGDWVSLRCDPGDLCQVR